MFNLRQVGLLMGLVLALSTSVRAQSSYQGFGYYAATNGTVTITNYSGAGGAVVMPSVINGLPVATIWTNAFNGNTNLTSLVIGTNVTSIRYSAFANCQTLAAVTLPASLTSLGNDVFYKCGLTSVSIPGSLGSISQSAFQDCGSLASVTIAGSVTNLGIFAFGGCGSLTNVLFQGNAPGQNPDVFYDFFTPYDPATVYFQSGTSGWGLVFDGEPTALLNAPASYGSLTVTLSPAAVLTSGAQWQVDGGVWQASGATALGLSAGNHTVSFAAVSGYTTPANVTVTISANSTATASGAYVVPTPSPFTYSTNIDGTLTLTGYTGPGGAVTVPATYGRLPVTAIGNNAFQNSGVTSVTIASGITNLGNEVFFACDSLASVTLPNSVIGLGVSDFAQCGSLTSVTLSTSLTGIPATTFQYCSSLKGVAIPNGVTSIGQQAFANCSSLTAITLPNSVTSLVDAAFEFDASLTTVTLSSSLTQIGNSVFAYCAQLPAVTLPNSITSIGGSAFASCGSLSGVTIPNGVTSIGAAAFSDCTSLTGITLGIGLVSIGDFAFSGSGLTGITLPASVTTLGEGPFSGAVDLSAFTVANANLYFVSQNGVLVTRNLHQVVAYPPAAAARTYAVSATVTNIMDWAFADSGLTSVTLPNSVTSVGVGAFSGSASLTTVTNGNAVGSLGAQAFADCPNLQGIYFTGDAPAADASVFAGDTLASAYYYYGARNWGTTLGGIPTVELNIPTGSVEVGIGPAGAVAAGAQWQVDGGAYQASGATVTNLVAGSHTVSFKTISGWTAPVAQTVTIVTNTLTIIDGVYIELPGALSVTISPAAVVSAGAEWSLNGGAYQVSGALITNLPATNVTVAFKPVAGWTTPAAATVVITNGQTTADAVTYADALKPGLTLLSPAPGQVVSNLAFTVSGTATDNWQVANVYYSLNSGGWSNAVIAASGTNWSASVTLTPGTNTVAAYAVDPAGDASPVASNKVICVIHSLLTVLTNQPGWGTISPNDNGASLIIGSKYTLTATAAAGFQFANWTNNYGLLTNSPVLTFAMQSNLLLTASFVDTQKPSLTITAPTAGQRTSNSVFTVKGVASDNAAVAAVSVQVNGGSWTYAAGTNNWSVSVNLAPGTNIINAFATDTSGNVSATNRVPLDFVVTNQLVLRLAGQGAVSPNYSNAWLEVGRNYTMTATPAAGFQFVSWTNNFGLVTNTPLLAFVMQPNLALTATLVDTQKPSLTITAPVAGQRTSNTVFLVKGVASDNVAVAGVSVQVNGGSWTNATGTNNWSVSVNLAPGTNSISAFATDTSGNTSPTNTVLCDFVVTNQLGVRLNGLGTLTPNDSNVWLEVGRNYTITAAPATGFVFTNWTVATNWVGGAITNKPTVQFMMASNLTLTANFAETTRPVVTITNLTAGQKVASVISVKGTASDNWQVTNVWCEIGSGGWVTAVTTNGYKNWSVTNLSVFYGTNLVRVCAQNLGGLYSTTNTLSVVDTNLVVTADVLEKALVAQPAPVLSELGAHLTANGLALTLQITGAASGVIQVSTNLTDWATVTNFAGTNTAINFCDPAVTNFTQRYYRAVAP